LQARAERLVRPRKYNDIMKSGAAFLGTLILVLLGGCAMQWSRPNVTKEELAQDRDQCEQEAQTNYPVVMLSNNIDANAITRSNAVDACLRAKGYVFR
jgi:hypothetical protein